ncbi:hypothetical protein [Massilibacteroides vaginae]|uniref:hypothetical protein n=1 Tax=Massilibacteroides vaginae TaxID=1673718 RepID=UPI0015941E31|nr:hypothetical protein [Massilibacteroides vaginae]
MKLTSKQLEVREKYSGLSYDELVQTAQDSNMSDLDFILAQPELSEEFKTWLSDRDLLDDFEEADATLFLEEQEMFLTYHQEDF